MPMALLHASGAVFGLWHVESAIKTDLEIMRWGFPDEITFELTLVAA